MSDEAVGCSVCHRAIHARHADDQGRCSECRPTRAERAADRAAEKALAVEERATHPNEVVSLGKETPTP